MPKSILKQFEISIREVFRKRIYFFMFLLVSLLLFFIYVFIPIYFTPGNDLKFFVSITPWWGFLILIVLSILMSLLIAMQVYILKHLKRIPLKEGSSGAVAWFSSIISGIFTSASCASCVTVVFAFLGAGGVLFLLKYRWYISAIGFIFILISLISSMKRINNHCKSCSKVCKK